MENDSFQTDNGIGEKGTVMIGEALKVNRSLSELNMQSEKKKGAEQITKGKTKINNNNNGFQIMRLKLKEKERCVKH